MLHLIVSWFLSALALWLVAQIIPGIKVRDFGAALVATVVIAIVSVTVGPVHGFWSAVAGSVVLTILTAILRHMVFLPGHEWTHSSWNTW
jgi:putative membrane protein